jgi:hypothetical protein
VQLKAPGIKNEQGFAFEAGITLAEVRAFFGIERGGLARRAESERINGNEELIILRQPKNGFAPGSYEFIVPPELGALIRNGVLGVRILTG